MNTKKQRRYVVLYDGLCLFCGTAQKLIQTLDWFSRVELLDLYDKERVGALGVETPTALLQEKVHLIDRQGEVYVGFYACRKIGTLLPLTFLPALLLYLPGIPSIGTRIYAWIAKNRT